MRRVNNIMKKIMKKINDWFDKNLWAFGLLCGLLLLVIVGSIMNLSLNVETSASNYNYIKIKLIEYPELCPVVNEYMKNEKISDGEMDDFRFRLRKLQKHEEMEIIRSELLKCSKGE
jgi:hypothetical protein